MANTIDYGTLCLGALIGVGCRKQLKVAAKVAATTAANLAGATAAAVSEAANQIAEQTKGQQDSQGQQAQNPQNGN